ncbi:polyphosphate kinase [Amylibacter marinus]|uniref:Polyphosphate kinase n=1 Tax=Amylibacter marinus TaxID=1475483 RepID=A0ABQ5VUY4_9RHOB|nr:RNA degradosome polyphosphate kinase [Amylibacter marinus]GLQ34964.1 polyphosphate kinase [Amylibacter marinus]
MIKTLAQEKNNPADFLNQAIPNPTKVPDLDPNSAQRFANRELTWLAFNWRVLDLAQDKSWPLLERVRMLSISSSNLDEFFTVRVAGLRELIRADVRQNTADGMLLSEQLALIDKDASDLMEHQQVIWADLRRELAGENINILKVEELTAEDTDHLRQFFLDQIFPILSPLAVDPAHPFPFIPSGGLTIALQLQRMGDGKPFQVLLPIPSQVDRFISLKSAKGALRLLPLEEMLLGALDVLFPDCKLVGHCIFRVLRDSDLEIVDEAEDLVHEFESALKKRQRGVAVRLKISANAPEKLQRLIIDSLDMDASEVFTIDGISGLQDLSEICALGPKDMVWSKYSPRVPERIQDFKGDIFAAIRQKDMLLHHPYESFDVVVGFLQQAARDKDVLAIKQTLYRTSHQSPIVDALCRAAESGKSVTAVVELKARFDEAANIRLSRQLEKAGVHVVYGFIDLKTHAKVSTVVRREHGELHTYTHFGTGNYHPVTANIYSDLSYFTRSKSLGQDATKLFNYLSGYAQVGKLNKLSIAPAQLFDDLIAHINAETKAAKEGRPAQIWAKMNSLIETDVIDALYRASQAGVKIDLVVRGICGLRPGVQGLSENIRVKSIVGRFLEHSRIVCFANGTEMPNKGALVFMSSADWMGRNLHGRVETLVRITNKTVHAQIISQIMAANMADVKNSWVMQADGSYVRQSDENGFDCHRFFMENPSLSGRGKVGAKDVPELAHGND